MGARSVDENLREQVDVAWMDYVDAQKAADASGKEFDRRRAELRRKTFDDLKAEFQRKTGAAYIPPK
jgi:hypothetical protein